MRTFVDLLDHYLLKSEKSLGILNRLPEILVDLLTVKSSKLMIYFNMKALDQKFHVTDIGFVF